MAGDKTGLQIEAWEPLSLVPSALSRSDESSVAVGIALPQYATIASPEWRCIRAIGFFPAWQAFILRESVNESDCPVCAFFNMDILELGSGSC